MSIIFKIDMRRQLAQASGIFVHFCIALAAPYMAEYQLGEGGREVGVEFAMVYFPIIFIIHAIIHFRYYVVNRNDVLSYDPSAGSYYYVRNGTRIKFTGLGVCSITHHFTRSPGRRSLHYFPWNSYDYSRIQLKSGESLIVTSLLMPGLKWPSDFSKEKKVVHLFFCWPAIK